MSTPQKSQMSSPADMFSPDSKRALEFDFASEIRSKIPKVVEEDLKEMEIKELKKVPGVVNGAITGKCLAVLNRDTVVKIIIHDNNEVVCVSAFSSLMDRLRLVSKGDTVSIKYFTVSEDEKQYQTGNKNKVSICLAHNSLVTVKETPTPFSLSYDFVPIQSCKKGENATVVDVKGVVVKDWGTKGSAYGPAQRVSLFDESETTILLSIQLNKTDVNRSLALDDVILVKSAVIHYEKGIAFLQGKWFSSGVVNPAEYTDELLHWKEDYMQRKKEKENETFEGSEEKEGHQESQNESFDSTSEIV